jgi:hypothetical protein
MPRSYSLSDLDPERLSRIRYRVPDPTGLGSTTRVGSCLGLPDKPPPPPPPSIPTTAVEGGLFSLVTTCIVQHKHTCLPPLCPSAQEETETGEKMRDRVRIAEHAIRSAYRVSFLFQPAAL